MRMVIDSNYLQCSALRDYLAASTDNYAVITDYAAMEAYKGDAQVRLIPLSQVTATMAQADVLEASEARTNFLGRQARGDPVLASYRGLIDS